MSLNVTAVGHPSDSLLRVALELCVLLWATDGNEETLSRYEDTVLALVPKHGGRVVSRVRSLSNGEGPLEVQIIHLPGESALQAYMRIRSVWRWRTCTAKQLLERIS